MRVGLNVNLVGRLTIVFLVVVALTICETGGATTKEKDKQILAKKKIVGGQKTRSDVEIGILGAETKNEKNETVAVGLPEGVQSITVEISKVSPSNLTDNATADVSKSNSTAAAQPEKEEDKETVSGETDSESSSEGDKEVILDEDKVTETEDNNDEEASKPKPVSFMTRLKNLLKRVLNMLGFSRQKRKTRLLTFNGENSLDSTKEDYYTEEVRATVGALLGKRDCYRRAVCGAGSYLRHVRGKEVLIVLLEKFIPPKWKEPVNFIKEAAIYQDKCDYECLQEDL